MSSQAIVQPLCQGTLDRRAFVRSGLTGMSSLGLADLLALESRAKEVGRSVASNRAILVVWLWGGPSHMETFDLKPLAPSEHRGEFQPSEIGELEPGPGRGANDEERIARHDVAEADEIGAGFLVVHHHHAQRPAPHDVDLAGAQRLCRGGRAGRRFQHHFDPGVLERTSRVGGIEGRVKQRAEIFRQKDRHRSVDYAGFRPQPI